MATKKTPAPKKAGSREMVVNIRLSPTERKYLGMGAEREDMGPLPLTSFLRRLALQRGAQTLGITLAQFEQQQRPKRRR